MRRILASAVLAFIAVPAWAGLTYDFKSSTEGQGGGNLTGSAAIEGQNIRMEITDGDDVMFKDNSVVLSKNGGSTLVILDPKNKTYTELEVDQVFSALGSMMKSMGGMFKMSIKDPKVSVREAGDGGTIEGYPTRKYLIDSSYELAMKVMGMSRSTQIESQTEAWATDKIKPEFMTFVQQRGLRTGMADFDELISKQAAAIKGFPLKQVIRTKTTSGGKSQTSTTTMTISNIKEVNVPDSKFAVPAGYEKTEMPELPFGN